MKTPIRLGRKICAFRKHHSRISRIQPVLLDIRGIGSGDNYRVEGFGRYYCRTCRKELGSGEFAARIEADFSIDVDHLPAILGPALGMDPDAGARISAADLR
jgi:hypothetical protein